MSQTRMFGLILIAVGILFFSYQGLVVYQTREKVIDAGPLQVTSEKTHESHLPEIAGSVCLIAGIVMVVGSMKHA